MRIGGLGSIYTSGVSEVQLRASHTQEPAEMLRIAEKSKDSKALLALAMNRALSSEAVQALFDRDIAQVTRRLESLGYEQTNFVQRLLGWGD